MAVVAATSPRELRVRPRVAPAARREPPPRRPGFVDRPALLEALDELSASPLTVVCAPTGYGKTTLLARWAKTGRRRVAWAALSQAEREPVRFWRLVAAAVAEVVPDLAVALRIARAAADRPAEEQPELLAAGLAASREELVLVLDDLHAIAGSDSEAALARLLALAPATVHVVVATRVEPALSLPVRRERGELGELRVPDLRFTPTEAAQLVRRAGGGALGPRELALLAERSEGWPAGLHLAALAVAASDRPAEAAASFSGAARDVADYLRQEVLDAQTDEHRDFLVRTALLEQPTAALCDALLSRTGSQAVLESLAASGTFLVPVDGQGRAFRYLRPARDFLRAELDRVAPESVSDLHRRAALACERAGLVDEAAAHACAAGDEPVSVVIARRHALELVRAGRSELLGELVADPPGGRRRPEVETQLRRVAGAAADAPLLLAEAEKLARLCAGLPAGPVSVLARETAGAARVWALLLAGRTDDAYAAATGHAEIGVASAASAQIAAAGSLAAGRLGLHAAAGPLARSSASAVRAAGVRTGLAVALADAAAGALLAQEGATPEAVRRLELAAAAADGDRAALALVLALLARARVRRDPHGARSAIERARRAAVAVAGAALLDELLAEAEREVAPAGGREPATRDLSQAELRVLRLLATRLTQREIAHELYLSPNTVKTHTRVIYRKLDVSTRETAVRAARELNLV